MKTDILHKEIDLIQSVISRTSNNSFLLKGWLITLIAVILAFSRDSIVIENITYLSIVLCLPVIVFWYLDAFFLHKEKCYRKLFDWTVQHRPKSNEFLYSLDYTRFRKEVPAIWKLMLSKTLLPIYGLTITILITVFFVTFFHNASKKNNVGDGSVSQLRQSLSSHSVKTDNSV